VVPYLTEEGAFSTLRFIGSLPGGAEVAFDYSNPPDSLSGEMRAVHEARASRVAEIGEAWVSYFDSDALDTRLRELGFTEVEDLGPPQIALRYFPQWTGSAPAKGGHIVRAATLAG
jgi:O-methyltransferase involved in polyketide biosynthesis